MGENIRSEIMGFIKIIRLCSSGVNSVIVINRLWFVIFLVG